jgi:hypothetical protein
MLDIPRPVVCCEAEAENLRPVGDSVRSEAGAMVLGGSVDATALVAELAAV